MSRYISPVNPTVFPHLTVVLLAIGMFFTAWFFVYEVTSTKYTRDIYKEFLISLVASLFMGFGVLFLLLWVSIYIWAPKGSNQAASLNPCFCKLIFFILLLLEMSHLLLTIKADMTKKKRALGSDSLPTLAYTLSTLARSWDMSSLPHFWKRSLSHLAVKG